MALHPKVVLPDYLALLLEPETWSVALQNKIALVRIDKQNGFSVDADNLFLFLQLALEKIKIKNPRKLIFGNKTVSLILFNWKLWASLFMFQRM